MLRTGAWEDGDVQGGVAELSSDGVQTARRGRIQAGRKSEGGRTRADRERVMADLADERRRWASGCLGRHVLSFARN